jgi:hypothetical protein
VTKSSLNRIDFDLPRPLLVNPGECGSEVVVGINCVDGIVDVDLAMRWVIREIGDDDIGVKRSVAGSRLIQTR